MTIELIQGAWRLWNFFEEGWLRLILEGKGYCWRVGLEAHTAKSGG
jgi:hypothetical protein